MKKTLAHCRLDCAQCPVYIASTRNSRAMRENLARSYSTPDCTFAPEDMHCMGCRSFVVSEKMCLSCPMRICATGKKTETCGRCAAYPCAIIHDYLPADAPHRRVLDAIHTGLGAAGTHRRK